MSSHGQTTVRRRLRSLHVLADDDPRWKQGPVEQAAAACRGGAAVVQLRAKRATDGECLAWAKRIRELTHEVGALFVLNDRFDLALLSDADGVHLGQDDLPPAHIPDGDRARLLVGRSTHTLEQARAACDEPIDYLAFGPIFRTQSKASEYAARGVDALVEVVALAGALPVVAIGGIDPARIGSVSARGAGAAVISAVAGADAPETATRALVRLLSEERT